MPSTIKIHIHEARDLPVMDRSSKLTDAFVTIKFASSKGDTTDDGASSLASSTSSYTSAGSSNIDYHVRQRYETRIVRKTLSPVFNEDFRVGVAEDIQLQDESIRFTVSDKDYYTSDDAIGGVSLDL